MRVLRAGSPMRARLVAGLAVALLLTGCADEPGGPAAGTGDDEGPSASTAAPGPAVQSYSFALGAAVGLPVGGAILPIDDGRRTPFDVPAGYSKLEATAEWACEADALCELELELRKGEQDLMTSGFGPSPVALQVDDPPSGHWTFWAFPSGQGSVVASLEGTVTISLS